MNREETNKRMVALIVSEDPNQKTHKSQALELIEHAMHNAKPNTNKPFIGVIHPQLVSQIEGHAQCLLSFFM